VRVYIVDLRKYCDSLKCDDECVVVQGFNVAIQQTVYTAYCVCNMGYARVRVIEGFTCASQ